jgi:RHS repeat-associated protein
MTAPIAASAAASRTASGPSRLYVGSTLRAGAQARSTSGVYRIDVMSGGRVEILKNGRLAWRSGAVIEIAHAVSLGATKPTNRVASHARRSGAETAPSYLSIDNDGDVALVTKAGIPIWHGGLHARVSGLAEAPYTAGAFYGDTNPSVTCYTCEASNVTGNAPPSNTLDAGTSVDAMTGDFSTSLPLFDAAAIGGDLSLTLSYDAQLAQSDLVYGASGLTFGEGWSSNFSSSVTMAGQSVSVNQGNGSQVMFNESSDLGASTSCQLSGDPTQTSGDYPFTAKYTISGSAYNFCALDSVQGQLSETPGTGFTYQVGGGASIQNYAWNGQLIGATSNTAQSVSGGTAAQGLEYYSASAGTNSEGGIALDNMCPTSASHGCNIINAHDGRDIVEVLNVDAEASEVIDPSGSTYTMTYSSTSLPNNLTSVTVPSPTGTGTATWTYEYATASYPYGSDLVQIYDPDNTSPTGYTAGALHSTTITYGTGTYAGMVSSLVDGSGLSATTSYSYASACATGQCAASGQSQTTTILYPAECPSSTTSPPTCSMASWPTNWPTTVTNDIPQEIDQYTSGIETSSQLGSETLSGEVETWLYNWNFGNGAANTSEQITYPDTLQGSSPVLQTETIITDPAGNIISTINPLGDVATSSYNESSSLNIPEMAWSYPGPSSNSSSSPPTGSSQYTYNTFGQVVTATDPLGNITFYGYYANYSLLCYVVSPALGQRLAWTSASTPPTCTSSYTTYDAGALSAPTGATTYSYDEQGDVAGQTIDAGDTGANADPKTTTASYNFMGDILWEIPATGQAGSQSSSNAFATSYAYVANTSLPSYRYQPDGVTTQYAYDLAGNLTSSGNAGVTPTVFTTMEYDGDNRPCYQLNASGAFGASCAASPTQGSTSWTYEPGTTNVFQTTDSNNHSTYDLYGDLAFPNSPTQVQDAANSQDQYSAYNDYGEACVYGDTAPSLGTTQCSATPSGDSAASYDALGNQLTITDPSGNTTTNSYEDASFPTLQTRSVNSMGATTKFIYDVDGDLETTVNPDLTGVSENYNADGEVCNKTPSIVQYLCGQGPSVAGVTQYGYNDADELTSMSDNTGNPAAPTLWSQATTYTYTEGQLTSTTDGNSKTLNYAYNDAGEVSCIGYPVSTSTNCASAASGTNSIVTRNYDALGRVSSVEDWLGNTTSYTYGDQWTPTTPTTITYPTSTGVTANYGFDPAGNLSSLGASSTVTSGTAISDSWTDNVDEQVNVSSINGATSSSAAYNGNKQITQATNLASSTSNDVYTLAINGNITKDAPPAGSATNFTYASGGNELCNTSTSATTCGGTLANGAKYAFTTNGQRASTTPYVSSLAGTTTNYNWNSFGQLCSSGPSSSPISTPCGTLPAGGTEYQYNGDGLRISTMTSSSTTYSTWDAVSGGDIPLNINDATTAGTSITNTSYIYGDLLFGGTAPIEQITTNSSGTSVSYLVSNRTGLQGVYKGSGSSLGSVQEMAIYTLYGIQTISSGTKVTAFGFQGSYSDSTGLIYLINRYFDPSTDQFLSIDPDVATTNQPYAYVGDNPLNATDPMGWIPQLMGQETDDQQADVGLTYEITVESNTLNELTASVGVQVHDDQIAAEDAAAWGTKDQLKLESIYRRALNHYVNISLSTVTADASDIADLYNVTSSYLKMSASQSTYEDAYDALYPYIGSGTEEESAFSDAVDAALSDLIPDVDEFASSLQEVAMGGGVIGVAAWYFLWWIGD